MNADQFKTAFIEEATELLSSLESKLLEMEEFPDDKEKVSAVFRIIHTIKGSSAMFGFEYVSEFTHHIENILDAVREDKLAVSRELIDWTLKSGDHITALIEADELPDVRKALIEKSSEIVAKFQAAVNFQDIAGKDSGDEKGGSPAKKSEPELRKEPENLWRIKFKPSEDIFMNGTNPILLIQELAELGETLVLPDINGIPDLDSIDPEKCYIFWDILLLSSKGGNEIRDVFIFVENESELIIEMVPDANLEGVDGSTPKLGQILLDRGDIDEDALRNLLGKQKRLGELILENNIATEEAVEKALSEQNFIKTVNEKRAEKEKAGTASLRVNSDKLDELVNLVGELVTVHARIDRESASTNAELHSMVEQLGRITESLRENTMSMRLLPIGTTFSRFKRLVRDLSNDMGKTVNLVTEGEETELDKTVIEKLNDPLVHLIRNSLDHGIEAPDIRRAAGKPAEGTLTLKAEHAGASVRIIIEDDGAGLNKRKILDKALKNKIITTENGLTEEEIFQMIFAPGFSTAAQVTNVSGRGVGMDVVKRQIESLNGTVRIESSEGEFTRISLSLPLTLAIIDGFLVSVSDHNYIFPLGVVEACIESKAEDRPSSSSRKMIPFRGALLPYIDLRTEFGIDDERPEIEQIVVVKSEGQQVGFCVDRVIGENQTVIKSLSSIFKNAKGFSGATILGDGTVALILDTEGLIKTSKLKEENFVNGKHS